MHPRIATPRRLFAGAVALSATFLAVPLAQADDAPAAPEGYDLMLLKSTDGYVTASANGLNNDGDVVGLTRPSAKAQPQEAALWHAGEDTAHILPQLDGSQFARAFDVATDGTAAGEAFNSTGNSVPVAWSEGIVQLPTPNDTGLGVAQDIALDGTVLATATATVDGKRVAYTTDGDTVTLLPEPTPEEGRTSGFHAASIADGGSYVAGVATITVPHGDHSHDERLLAVWHDENVHVYEGDNSHYIVPLGVNDTGLVVGTAKTDSKERAVVWSNGEQLMLAAPDSDYPHTSARAVNDSGVIVGGATKFAGNASFGGSAVAWFGDEAVVLDELVDLPSGVSLESASDINASGQIVGTAVTPEGRTGFLLSPMGEDEPTPTPTNDPTVEPTAPTPTNDPTVEPTAPTPTNDPTVEPPTPTPTDEPSSSPAPTHGQPTTKPWKPGNRPGLPSTGG